MLHYEMTCCSGVLEEWFDLTGHVALCRVCYTVLSAFLPSFNASYRIFPLPPVSSTSLYSFLLPIFQSFFLASFLSYDALFQPPLLSCSPLHLLSPLFSARFPFSFPTIRISIHPVLFLTTSPFLFYFSPTLYSIA